MLKVDPQRGFLNVTSFSDNPLVGSVVSGLPHAQTLAHLIVCFYIRVASDFHVRACREPLTPPEPQPHLWNEDTIRFFLQQGGKWWINAFWKETVILIVPFHPLACFPLKERRYGTTSASPTTICTVTVQSVWWNERSASLSFLP